MPAENEAEVVPKRGGKKIVLAVVLAVGALVGGGAGAFFAGPALAEMILGPATATAEEVAAEDESHSTADDGHDAGGAASYLVENLVLNPAQSNGTRFLMASVSFELMEIDAVAAMEARDAQVRDAVLTVLGQKTVEELTDIARRDSLKTELKTAVSGMFPEGTVRGIYLPQFVIQ